MSMCVQFRDPGILDPLLNYSHNEVQAQFLKLNQYETEVKEKDEVFQKSEIYKTRYCNTCQIQRPPKASHCRMCNNCVQGFDHHCTMLNNCVGARNLKFFVAYLFLGPIYACLEIITGWVLIGHGFA